ncbi:hypothetical protein ACP70R_030769 [Stipagrostis hirtigluma subsp. patula]
MPSSSRRRRRRRSRKDPPPAAPLHEHETTTRNWAALPRDVQWALFSRLPQADILRGAGLACASWRRTAVDEPLLWRHINIASQEDDEAKDVPARRMAMARAAVDRAGGGCESYRGPADPSFLAYLAARSPSLRGLEVTSRLYLPDSFVGKVIAKLPMLERLVLRRGLVVKATLRALMEHCPRLELLHAGGCYMMEAMGSRMRARLETTIKDLALPPLSGGGCSFCSARATRIAEEEDD